MHLLIYSHFFAPSIGGVETIVQSLACGLAEVQAANGRRDFELTLVTQTPLGGFDDTSLALRVVRQPSFFTLRRLVAAADLVHVAGPAILPMMLAKLAGKPFVVEHHGFQTICPNGQLLMEPSDSPCPGHFMAGRHSECFRCNSGQGWLASGKLWVLTFVRRFLSSKAAANVVPTRWLGELVRLPNTKPVAHGLAPKISTNSSRLTAGPPVIVFQGRLVTTKGVRVLLDAAKRLLEQKRTFELLIVGDGPERASLERFVDEANLKAHVRFCGRLGTDELETILSQASVVVVPSLGGEVFGLVVAESMQRGLPVIASDLGAFVEVLGEAGLVFRTGDAVELAERVGSLLSDGEKRELLGRRAAERITDHFSLEAMIEGHAALYRQILKR